MNKKSKTIPKTTTIQKWKENHPWLYFTDKSTLISTIYYFQEEKLKLVPFARMIFIKASMNYKPSTLKDHKNTEMHKRAVQEKEFDNESKSGFQIKQKVIEQHIPKNSPLVAGFQRMDQAEDDTLVKLHDIAYYIVLRNHSFIELKHLIELEEIHGVSYPLLKYMNETDC